MTKFGKLRNLKNYYMLEVTKFDNYEILEVTKFEYDKIYKIQNSKNY